MNKTIVVAGATGNLGTRIVKALLARGAIVRAMVRPTSSAQKIEQLRSMGAGIFSVDPNNLSEVAKACDGSACVVSALLGLGDTMVDTQTILLNAAVQAGVPRFIPSDYSMDFTKLAPGENRNLDWHLAFQERVDRAPIKATSILNGAFTELLVGPAPFLMFKLKRVLVWGSADVPLEFTTMDNTAEFTAAAALDDSAPRFLRVAGEVATARQLADIATQALGEKFKVFRAGSLGVLKLMIKVMRATMPAPSDPFPPWQGMQYMHNMYAGHTLAEHRDNARYPDIKWVSIREVLQRPRVS